MRNSLNAQEIFQYENGLIYSPQTIKRLNQIADSLNVQYRKCEIRKSWKAFDQTYGFHYYDKDSVRMPQLLKALKDGKSRSYLEELLKVNGSTAETDTLLLIQYDAYEEDSNCYQTYIAQMGYDYIIAEELSFPLGKIKSSKASDGGIWYWEVVKSRYEKKISLSFYYCIKPFKQSFIPQTYNEWINYSQCMVDTTTDVYIKGAKGIGGFYSDEDDCSQDKKTYQKNFELKIEAISGKYFEKEPEEPVMYEGKNKDSLMLYKTDYDKYELQYNEWERKKQIYIKTILDKDTAFFKLASKALKEAKESNCFSFTFVNYIALYYNKSYALDLKRSRYRIGICSMDSSPRSYLSEIASLSADAGRWDVFLRAHLNLINDRVYRNSDNSSAVKYRGLYVRELEALPMDLPKLFPGMMFRINNAPKYHYYNTLVRSAKAMSMTSDSLLFTNQLLTIAKDTSLDVFNRVIFAHVYENLLYYRKLDKINFNTAYDKLIIGIQDLPFFIRQRFIKEEE
ncbi:MAG TPA: hypothetical protein VK766_00930 [Cytophagaceae bacterium]|nr:hypothetical protein [Cytophagaceae bacterium]